MIAQEETTNKVITNFVGDPTEAPNLRATGLIVANNMFKKCFFYISLEQDPVHSKLSLDFLSTPSAFDLS